MTMFTLLFSATLYSPQVTASPVMRGYEPIIETNQQEKQHNLDYTEYIQEEVN